MNYREKETEEHKNVLDILEYKAKTTYTTFLSKSLFSIFKLF
jgi:hypothetical protein